MKNYYTTNVKLFSYIFIHISCNILFLTTFLYDGNLNYLRYNCSNFICIKNTYIWNMKKKIKYM